MPNERESLFPAQELADLREAAEGWPTPNRYTDAIAVIESRLMGQEIENARLRYAMESADSHLDGLNIDGAQQVLRSALIWKAQG